MTEDKQTLVPVEQKTVVFYGDELMAVMVMIEGQNRVFVPLRPICDFLGVSWQGQHRRIMDDVVMSEVIMSVNVMLTDIERGNRVPKNSQMLCLPLEYINGFLFGINPKRVKPEIAQKLISYQRECYHILANAFLETSQSEGFSTSSPEEQMALVQIREMGRAIMQMAEEQLQIMQRLDQASIVVGQHGKRILAIERQLAPREAITDEQAADIAEKVKAIAMTLTEQDSGKNHFQAIFGELHRRYRVSSYKNIRQSQYQSVLGFLDEWYEATSKKK